MRLLDVWVSADCTPPLNVLYYVTLFSNSIDTLFATVFGDEVAGMAPAHQPRSNVSYMFTKPVTLVTALARSLATNRARAGKPPPDASDLAQIAERVATRFRFVREGGVDVTKDVELDQTTRDRPRRRGARAVRD